MTTLAAQQRALSRAIVGDPDAAGGLLRSLGAREPLLQVYRHAYTARLTAALRDNYGVLPQVLGDEAFDALALAYLEAHPSQQPSIRWFGHRLSDFMRTRDDLVPHPACIDLARMEWALRDAFDAADATPMDAAALADVPPDAWPSITFDARPGVQLLALDWNVAPVWRALQGVGSDEAPELPEPEPLAHALLVWRGAGLETRWRSMDTASAQLLCAAIAGEPFGALCELVSAQVGTVAAAQYAASALRGWLADGLFSG